MELVHKLEAEFLNMKASVQVLGKSSQQLAFHSRYFTPVCSDLEEHLLPAEPY